MSPIARLAAALAALITLAGALMLGLVFLAVILGLGLLLGIAAWVRGWWLRRALGGASPTAAGTPNTAGSRTGNAIEAEYTVVATERRQDRAGQPGGDGATDTGRGQTGT